MVARIAGVVGEEEGGDEGGGEDGGAVGVEAGGGG